MAKYVISPDVGLCLAERNAAVEGEHRILAPTLFRSQILSLLYRAVQQGRIAKTEADRRLSYLRSLRIRYLGDRVLQAEAWKIADQLGWPDTLDGECLALTRLQADAFITLNDELARAAKGVVPTASVEALSKPGPSA